MTGPTEGTCVEQPHAHVGQCYRRGLADGYAQGLAALEASCGTTWPGSYGHTHRCRHPDDHPGRHVCKCRSWVVRDTTEPEEQP